MGIIDAFEYDDRLINWSELKRRADAFVMLNSVGSNWLGLLVNIYSDNITFCSNWQWNELLIRFQK